jgi:hypothetical protein
MFTIAVKRSVLDDGFFSVTRWALHISPRTKLEMEHEREVGRSSFVIFTDLNHVEGLFLDKTAGSGFLE